MRITSRFFPIGIIQNFFLRLGGVNIGKNVHISYHARIYQNTEIGDNVTIRGGSRIGFSKIGNNVIIENNVILFKAHIGDYTHIKHGVKIATDQGVYIGKNCNILQNANFEGSAPIIIGDSVEMGANCGFYSVSSINRALIKGKIRDTKFDSHLITAPITVEQNCWFGPNAVVYPGVRIGHHSGVLGNSVVRKDVESYSLVGGNPVTLRRKIVVGRKISFQKPDTDNTKQ